MNVKGAKMKIRKIGKISAAIISFELRVNSFLTIKIFAIELETLEIVTAKQTAINPY